MITNERIDELLRQKAKIWGVGKQGNVFCVGLKFRPETLKNQKWLENKYEVYSKFFETEEEAKWFAEFGCIERTERLELPTWKTIQKDKNFHYIRYYHPTKDFSFFIEIYKFTNQISVSWSGGCKKTDPRFDENWQLTKENYLIACRKAKELFLGEKK